MHQCWMHLQMLLARVSDYLYDRGRWREMEVIDNKAYILCRRELGGKHPNTVRSMASLATAYHMLRRYEEAQKKLYRSAGATAGDSRR